MKTRVLVLGANGMLGHKLFLGLQEACEVIGTVRSDVASVAEFGIFNESNTLFGLDMRSEQVVARALRDVEPDIVINAIGIVKQQDLSKDALASLELNAVLPHRLAKFCDAQGVRLIHISTDCVFSGNRGAYKEDDVPDATDLYGRTKLLGEVTGPNCLTLRTSIIGLELVRHASLVEWFLRQDDKVRGYSQAIFSGLTTNELTRVIEIIIHEYPQLRGLYHVASEPISKFDLLDQLSSLIDHSGSLTRDESMVVNRSLDASRLQRDIGYKAPTWYTMLSELATDVLNRRVR